MMTFSDLMRGYLTAEISCLYKGTVVRRLTVKGDMVEVDALTETIAVPLSTPITYQPWMFDRGSLLFGEYKLCTEADFIRFPDGTTDQVTPYSMPEQLDEGSSDVGERSY